MWFIGVFCFFVLFNYFMGPWSFNVENYSIVNFSDLYFCFYHNQDSNFCKKTWIKCFIYIYYTCHSWEAMWPAPPGQEPLNWITLPLTNQNSKLQQNFGIYHKKRNVWVQGIKMNAIQPYPHRQLTAVGVCVCCVFMCWPSSASLILSDWCREV